MGVTSGQELLTLPEHMSSLPVFSGVRATRSLVLYECFVDRCLSLCTFSFGRWCCLFFFNIRILITTLVSSNASYVTANGHLDGMKHQFKKTRKTHRVILVKHFHDGVLNFYIWNLFIFLILKCYLYMPLWI